MVEDTLGTYCKELENRFTKERADKTKPLLVRLDGRAFHTYTKGLKRPYDRRLSECMIETTKSLIEEFHPRVGYTQSDEISLLFWADPKHPSSCLPFDGRIQKLIGVLAGFASSVFTIQAYNNIPEKRHFNPHLDARAWSVDSYDDVVKTFVWRMIDAKKNSVSMAAQSVYSHKDLLNIHTKQKIDMLKDKGIDWNDYPTFFKTGSFFRRKSIVYTIKEEERMNIPEKHRPEKDSLVIRSKILEETPPEKLTWEWLIS
jgi:tRNA(His) 5'-end guanylyltransferase